MKEEGKKTEEKLPDLPSANSPPPPPTPPSSPPRTKISLPQNLKKKLLPLNRFKKLSWPDKSTIFRLPQEFVSFKKKYKAKELFLKYMEKLSLTLSPLVTKPFVPDHRPTLHRVFIFLVLGLTAYGGAKIVVLALSPTRFSAGPSPDLAVVPQDPQTLGLGMIEGMDLFKAQGKFTKVPLGEVNTDEICQESSDMTSLPLKLVHTIVLMDSVKSLASVQVRNNKDVLGLREGDQIPALAKIDKIGAQKVILKNLASGACEFIEIKETGRRRGLKSLTVLNEAEGKRVMDTQNTSGSIRNVGNTYNIKKTLRSKVLSNISEVLTQARAVQIKNPDGTLSFRMTEIVPGSIYSQLNIQDGDIISSINGKKFRNIGEIMALFNQVAEINEFQVTLNRNGEDQTLEYNFE